MSYIIGSINVVKFLKSASVEDDHPNFKQIYVSAQKRITSVHVNHQLFLEIQTFPKWAAVYEYDDYDDIYQFPCSLSMFSALYIPSDTFLPITPNFVSEYFH